MQNALIDFCAYKSRGVSNGNNSDNQIIETIFSTLDLVPTPILIGMDPASTDIRSNAAGRDLFGNMNSNLSQTAALDDRPNFKVYRDDRLVPDDELPMQQAGATGLPVESPECELRFDDGRVKCIRGRAVPVFSRSGKVAGTIGIFFDVTEQRATERRISLLQEEMKHRAKNTLALVSAVARLTLKTKLDASDFDSFEARLQNIGLSLDVFTTDVGPSHNVHDVMSQTISKQVGSAISRVKLAGANVAVPLDGLVSLSMAVHELTTNACKYGALSVVSGSVDISWTVIADANTLAIDWIERGGPKVVPPLKTGFGSRFLSRILGSPTGHQTSINYAEHGVECRLYIRLN